MADGDNKVRTAEEEAAEAFASMQAGEQAAEEVETTEPAKAETPAPDTKAETTPEKPADGAQPPVSTEKDEVLDTLPESNPKPDDWKRMREEYKKLKAQAKAPVAQPAKLAVPAVPFPVETQPKVDTAPVAVAPPAPEGKPFKPEFLFDVLARVEAGELDAGYGREAEAAIREHLTPKDIRDVVLAAREGRFGDKSRDIANLAAQMVAVVVPEVEERRARETQKSALVEARSQAWQSVFSAIPDVRTPNSPNNVAFQQAAAELVQTLPNLWDAPHAPAVVAEYMKLKLGATEAQTAKATLAAKDAEIAELKKRLGISTSPQPPSKPAGGNGKPQTAEDMAREGLRAAGLAL